MPTYSKTVSYETCLDTECFGYNDFHIHCYSNWWFETFSGNMYDHWYMYKMGTRVPPGGGGTRVQRGAAPSLRISRKKGSFFKTSACPRFCKRRVLFCTQVRSMGVKIPLQSTKYTRLWRRVTPEVTQGFRVCCRDLLPLNKQRIIKSWVKIRVPVHPKSVFW